MKRCRYCGYSNYDNATQCRKCDASFVTRPVTSLPVKSYWVGPEKARRIRDKALAVLVVGLAIKVYWGGYGPWPVIDHPFWVQIRSWLEPLLFYGGAVGYLAGLALSRV
jgi:hypothetical protein